MPDVSGNSESGCMMVIINGLHLREGHPDAWRLGEVLPQEHSSLVAVLCQPRGRERKTRKILCSPTGLLIDSVSVRQKITENFGVTYT